MWKRISFLVRFTKKKVDSAQNTRENTREKTEENLERDLVNSKKERSSGKFKTPRNYKENSGDEIFRILSHMSKQRKEINGSNEKFKTPRNYKENSGDEIFRILSHMSKQRKEINDSMPQRAKLCMSQKEINQRLMNK